jgi:hypothetical protein
VTRRYVVVLQAFLCVLVLEGTAAGQQPRPAPTPPLPAPCPAPCTSFLITGGFLGFLDGFPEYPGWPGDTFSLADSPAAVRQAKLPSANQYGGVVGVGVWLETYRAPSALAVRGAAPPFVLLAGNNHPQPLGLGPSQDERRQAVPAPKDHWFWKHVAKLPSDAVAIGREDIHRWLIEMGPSRLVEWAKAGIAENGQVPFVASNVVIRRTGKALNVVAHEALGLELGLSSTESLGFLDEIPLSYRCAAGAAVEGGTFSFDGPNTPTITFDKPQTKGPTKPLETEDQCKLTLKLSKRLRPSQTYRLRARLAPMSPNEGQRPTEAVFSLVTDDVLTPHANGGPWADLPAVRVDRSGVRAAVMAFVTPEVLTEVPESYGKWARAEGCPAESCQLTYLPPAEAARQLLEMGAGSSSPAGTPPDPEARLPLLVALTDLSDTELGELLTEVPEIRVVSVHPESSVMGRAAPEVKPTKPGEPRYSGDLSFGSVIDEPHPELTRLMARPEWVGETVLEASVTASPEAATSSPWRLSTPSVYAHSIRGADLVPSVVGGKVTYQAVLDLKSSKVVVDAADRAFQAYCPLAKAGPFDASGFAQRGLWTSQEDFAALVLDTMRTTTRAEIALLPREWIDPSAIGWLADRGDGVNWLSAFILGRVLFRAERVVRVAVAGSALAKTLASLNELAGESGLTLCAAGLDLLDCDLAKLDAKSLFVSARRPQPLHYYGIVLPASLASAAKLEFDDEETREILPAVNRRLSETCPDEAAECRHKTLRAKLEELRASRIQRYLRLDPLSFEFARTGVHEPPTAQKIFGKLPVDGSSAKDNRTIAIDADGDWGILDSRRFALRVPGKVQFTRQDLDDATSFDKDEYSIGFRGDYKRKMKGLVRLFVGGFMEGRLGTVKSKATATRLISVDDPAHPGTVLEDLKVEGPKIGFRTERRSFVFGAVGAELPSKEWEWGTLSNVKVSFDYGRATNVPRSVRIAETEFSIDDFIRRGMDELLSEVYQADVDGVTDATPLVFRYGRPHVFRTQVDAKYEHEWDSKAKLTGEVRARFYRQFSDEPLLATRYSVASKVSFQWPIARRWTFGPYVEHTIVDVKQVSGAFWVTKAGAQLKLTSFFKLGQWRLFE